MRSKILKSIAVILAIVCSTFMSKAAEISRWSVDNLTTVNSTHYLYLKTNSPTSVTIHLICTRSIGETNFTLTFSSGTFDDNADGYNNTGFHKFTTFNITSADFENYSPGSVYLDYAKTFTIDSRTLTLDGLRNFGLFETVSAQGVTQTDFVLPTYGVIYIPSQGTYDQFSSAYSGTLFNYTPSLNIVIPSTLITPSDTQPVLVAGQKIYSPNHTAYLTLQTAGNLVLRKVNSDGTETSYWANGTQGKPSAALYLQTAGNLVIYPANATPANHPPNSSIWGSNIYSIAGLGTGTHIFYRLYDSGNLVCYWPAYDGYHGLVYIIADATDSDGMISPHFNTLSHPLWSPAMQQEYGSAFTPIPQ